MLAQRLLQPRAHRRAPQLEDRLVRERLHVVTAPGRREQLVDRDAARLVGQERVVGGVLEQAAHEVGHAGHEVADRAVGAHAQARAGDRLLERVAEAAQDLQLEVLVLAAGEPVVGDRVGDRAQVVARDGHAQAAARRARVEQPAGELLEVAVRVGLDVEDRDLPAVLARLDDLVVPVGALDEPDGQRRGALRARAGQPRLDRVERLRRVAQVGLEHHPGRRALAELLLGQQLEHELEHRVARVQRLRVDVQVRAELPRLAQQARAGARRRRACRARAPRAAAAA